MEKGNFTKVIYGDYMIGNAKDILYFIFNQEKDKIFEIKEFKKKRTLTSNAYYWVLLNKLAKN